MNLNIDHYPDRHFPLLFCNYTIKVDLSRSVKKKLGNRHLTNALALKIFKQIKFKSDVLAVLTTPIVFLPLSCIAVFAVFFIPTTGIVLTVIAMTLSGIAGVFFGFSYAEPNCHFLYDLSKAYRKQSDRAAAHIHNLKSANQEFRFTFA